MEGFWQSWVNKVYWHYFSDGITQSVSLSHLDNSQDTSNFFIIIMFDMLLCDQGLLLVSTDDQVNIFTNKLFLTKLCTIFQTMPLNT